MPQPTSYDRQNSFTLLAQVNPSDPYTGTDLDEEFNAIKVTLDELLTNIALIQRDDGDLANQSVGLDQLGASISIAVNPPSAWATATACTPSTTPFSKRPAFTSASRRTLPARSQPIWLLTSGSFWPTSTRSLWQMALSPPRSWLRAPSQL